MNFFKKNVSICRVSKKCNDRKIKNLRKIFNTISKHKNNYGH